MVKLQGISGEQAGKENVRRFNDYWERLRKNGQYLPLKPDGTVWVSKVAEDAGVGLRAMTGQNPELHALYEQAKDQTLEASRRAVEDRLAAGASPGDAGQAAGGDGEESVSRALKEKLRKLQQENMELAQKVAVLTIERDKALVELDLLRERFAQNEFRLDSGMNPGPY